MKNIFFLLIIILAMIFLSKQNIYSQMKISAGTMSCNIDGDTITFGLNTDLNNLYYMANGGTADFGLIKFQWDGVISPRDVKTMTLKLENGFIQDEATKISIIWADFYTNTPWIIKSGKFSVTENNGSTIKGTIEITAELAGSSIIGEFIKGKSQTVMKNGYFEINY